MGKTLAFILAIFLFTDKLVQAQLNSFSFEQLDSLQAKEERLVAVFVYTDWCKFCHAMEQTTFQSKEVQHILNQHFYFVELNAECNDVIMFQNQEFSYRPSGKDVGIHELAEQLASINKQVSYPATCFLNSDFEIVFQIANFIDAKTFVEILTSLIEPK